MAPSIFSIFVDRIEGRFAVCEMPDETMCDIETDAFPQTPHDRERYLAFLNYRGNIEIIRKAEAISSPKSKLPARLIRF